MYLIRVYYLKNIKSFNSTTKDNFKEWEKDLSKHHSKDDIQMANKCRKWCPTLLLIREKEIKTTVGSTEHLLCYAMLCYAKSLQSCPTLCDPIDSSPPGSAIPGILQARTLEWVAISFPDAWKWKVKVKSLSRIRLCATPWTAAYQAPPSMGFSRQEYWSGVPLPSPIYTADLKPKSRIIWNETC